MTEFVEIYVSCNLFQDPKPEAWLSMLNLAKQIPVNWSMAAITLWKSHLLQVGGFIASVCESDV